MVTDVRGIKYEVGSIIAKAMATNGSGSTCVQVRTVAKIENGVVFIYPDGKFEGRSYPIKYPRDAAILEQLI